MLVITVLLNGFLALFVVGSLRGGFLHNSSSWAWLCRTGASGSGATLLQIVCLNNGKVFLNYDFAVILSHPNYSIGCVEELNAAVHTTRTANSDALVKDGLGSSLLLVSLVYEYPEGDDDGVGGQTPPVAAASVSNLLCLYSIRLNVVLSIIQLPWSVNCLRMLRPATIVQHPVLHKFDGCLAIGSENGYLAFLDLRLDRLPLSESLEEEEKNSDQLLQPPIIRCRIVDEEMQSLNEIFRQFRHAQEEGLRFVLQIDGK